MSRGADELGWRRYPPLHPLVLVVSCQNPEWYEQADILEAVHAADQDRINREMLSVFQGSRGVGSPTEFSIGDRVVQTHGRQEYRDACGVGTVTRVTVFRVMVSWDGRRGKHRNKPSPHLAKYLKKVTT